MFYGQYREFNNPSASKHTEQNSVVLQIDSWEHGARKGKQQKYPSKSSPANAGLSTLSSPVLNDSGKGMSTFSVDHRMLKPQVREVLVWWIGSDQAYN